MLYILLYVASSGSDYHFEYGQDIVKTQWNDQAVIDSDSDPLRFYLARFEKP